MLYYGSKLTAQHKDSLGGTDLVQRVLNSTDAGLLAGLSRH